jgi:hypothetical protein
MAVIGDVLVKFIADFAEFSAGMDDAVKKLDEFAEHNKRTSDNITSFIGQVRTVAGTLASAFAVDRIRAYADQVEKTAVQIETLSRQLKLSTDQVQALQIMADKSGSSLDALAEYGKKNKAWLEDVTTKAREAGLVIDHDFIQKLVDINTKGELAEKRINAITTPLVAQGKSLFADMLESVAGSIDLIAHSERAITVVREVANILSLGLGSTAFGDTTGGKAQADLSALEREVVEARSAMTRDKTLNSPGLTDDQRTSLTNYYQQRIKAAEDALSRAQRAEIERQRQEQTAKAVADLPPVTVTASRTGGGGGKTDEDNVEAQIKRYAALAEAAKHTGETISQFHATNIEDFQREIKVQQQVDEIAAKLGAKYSEASEASKKALRDEISLYVTRKSENEKAVESAQKAADIERQYGDGSARVAKTRDDLSKAERTGIATKQALTRATKVQAEADEQARLEAMRYDDNMGSLAAGIEHAANAYARSNDLYSQGSQIFNGLTSAMGEGLDVLAGRSSKTFGDIAGDFALMLSKMAAQAAASQVFKYIFGAISLGSGYVPAVSATTNTIPDITTLISGLGQGGGRAAGGDVYPGNVYTVGESGPERFVPKVAGSIQPMGGRMGDVAVNVDMSGGQQRTDPKQAAAMARKLRTAVVDVITNEKRPGGLLHGGAT